MDKEMELDGYWWLPEHPDHRLGGSFKFSTTDAGVLELIGSFEGIERMGSRSVSVQQIILGNTDDGKRVSLFECYPKSTSYSFSDVGGQKASYVPKMAFIGAHFEDANSIRFRSIAVHYANLDYWLALSPISEEFPERKTWIIKYQKPDDIQVDLGDYRIDIRFSAGMSGDGITERQISHKAWMSFEFPEERALDDYLPLIRRLQDFLSLGQGQATFPLTIDGSSDTYTATLEGGRIYHRPIAILYRQNFPAHNVIPLKRHDMLFTFQDVKDHLKTHLENWMTNATHLEPVYNLYFATRYNQEMYLER